MEAVGEVERPGLRHQGLTSAEVRERRARHGENVLTPPPRDPWWVLFFAKFDDPVIRILLIAAGIAILVGAAEGEYVEGIGIVVAILLATTLAFLNEYRANAEFDILNKVNDDVPVKVIRDGGFTTVPRREVVVGDVVLVELGEEVPADGRVVDATGLQVNESKFTGEADHVSKVIRAPRAAEERAIAANVLLRGSTIVDGHGAMVATAVGDATEIGKTARAAAEATGEETPLNQQLERLSKWIGVVGLGVAALTFAALVVRGLITGGLVLSGPQMLFAALLSAAVLGALVRVWLPIVFDFFELTGSAIEPPAWLEEGSLKAWLAAAGLSAAAFALVLGLAIGTGWISADPSTWMPRDAGEVLLGYFMIAVTLIVVAVPEGLAMSVTLSLAYSMRKMTAANNLVRRMHACETIGAATVICCDKTGTLTLNEMRVSDVRVPSNPEPLASTAADASLVEAIAANSTANLGKDDEGRPVPLGNPTEGALLLWLADRGIDYLSHRGRFAVEHQWTFSTQRKYMATLGRGGAGRALHVKGAPEYVLERCRDVLGTEGPAPIDGVRAAIQAELLEFQSRGMRTLGFAVRGIPDGEAASEIENLATDMAWLGFVAIADPIRPEVPAAIAACAEAGVEVKMVTGDNPQTASEVSRQIGLVTGEGHAGHLVLGSDFAQMGDEQASHAGAAAKILSRARPLDKMRLVKLLQGRGHVVAVTGDGTNDAPALNYANVGLAMGKTGTAVAKEASDIVLLDDSFGSIVNAVMWGRSLYRNIQKFVVFQLTINVAALGIALLGPFIGVDLPLTVTQMLWINLIMDTFAALALAAEPPDPSVMRRPPRRPHEFIVSADMFRRIMGTGALFLVVFVALLFRARTDGRVDEYELTYFFTVFVLLQFWNLFNARCLGSHTSALRGLGQSPGLLWVAGAIVLGQALIVNVGGGAFRTVPLSLEDWLVILAGTSVVLWVGEAVRWVERRRAAAVAPQASPRLAA